MSLGSPRLFCEMPAALAFDTNALQNSCRFVVESPSGGRETNDLLFASADDVRRRQESHLHIFLGAGYQVAAATEVELVFDVLAMALDGFDTQVERMRDLLVAKSRAQQMEDVHLAIGKLFNSNRRRRRMMVRALLE